MDSPRRALVIDDEPGLSRLFQRYLRSLGWVADAVPDGRAALAAFGRGAYELVVCDVNLGEADGIETAKKLRGLVPSLRVVIVSGLPENFDRARAAVAAPTWSPRRRSSMTSSPFGSSRTSACLRTSRNSCPPAVLPRP